MSHCEKISERPRYQPALPGDTEKRAVTRDVMVLYLSVTSLDSLVLQDLVSRLNEPRFQTCFDQVAERRMVGHVNRRALQVSVKNLVAQKLRILSTNPSQKWLS